MEEEKGRGFVFYILGGEILLGRRVVVFLVYFFVGRVGLVLGSFIWDLCFIVVLYLVFRGFS